MSIFSAALENMKAATLEGEDAPTGLTEDGIATDVIPESPDTVIDDQAELDESVMLITSLSKDLDMFGNVGELASTEGLHPQTMRLIDPDNLMHTTIVGWPSVESLNNQLLPASSPDMVNALAGLEQFYGAATEGFFEAVGNFASKIGNGAVNFVKTGFAKLTGLFGRGSKDGLDDNAKVPGEKAGGVSLKIVLGAIAVIVAVAAVILKVLGKPLPINKEGLEAFKAMFRKEGTQAIKEIGGEVAENGTVTVAKEAADGTLKTAWGTVKLKPGADPKILESFVPAKQMGWTGRAFQTVRDKLNQASAQASKALTTAKNWVTGGAKQAKGANPLTAERAAQAAEAGAAGAASNAATGAAAATGEAAKKGFFSRVGEKFVVAKDAIVFAVRTVWNLIRMACSTAWKIIAQGWKTARRAAKVQMKRPGLAKSGNAFKGIQGPSLPPAAAA